jgi:hypothetical protein
MFCRIAALVVVLLAQGKGDDKKPTMPGPAFYAAIAKAIKEKKTSDTEMVGGKDKAFRDVPRKGALLIGFEVSYFTDRTVVRALRPIYHTSSGKQQGGIYGSPTRLAESVVAKKGYAVGEISVKAGAGIDGFEVTFMRIEGDALNPKDSYKSKWLGGKGGNDAKTLGGDGAPIIGVFGHVLGDRLDKLELRGLGLVTLSEDK